MPTDAAWLPDADVRRHIAKVSTDPDGNVDDVRLGSAAVVERVRPDLLSADGLTFAATADVKLGALMLAARFYARKGSPMGVASYAEFGAAQIVRTDPDVALLLGIGRHAFPKVR